MTYIAKRNICGKAEISDSPSQATSFAENEYTAPDRESTTKSRNTSYGSAFRNSGAARAELSYTPSELE